MPHGERGAWAASPEETGWVAGAQSPLLQITRVSTWLVHALHRTLMHRLLAPPPPLPHAQMEFWAELSQGNPSLSHLDSIGTEYEKCVKGAEHGFQTVLQLDRNSVATMRGYAQFLMDVSASQGEGFLAQLSLSSAHTRSLPHTHTVTSPIPPPSFRK